MANGTVRELVTKLTFKVDNSSLSRTNNAIRDLKQNLERLGGGMDSSLNNSLNRVRQNITRVSMSIRNLRRQMESLRNIQTRDFSANQNPNGRDFSNNRVGNVGTMTVRTGSTHIQTGGLRINSSSARVSGGNVTVTGFNPHTTTPPTNSTAGILNAIRNIRVAHADRVFVKGNISGGNHHSDGGDNPPPNPHDRTPPSGGGGRLRNFVDQSGNMLAAGAALIAPVVFPIREAMQFESAMADVKKVVDFDGAEEFKSMGKAIQDMSMKIPMAQEEIAAIVAAGGQAGGIEKEKLTEFAESAAKMGVAFDIPADKAGDMMAQWRTAFKMGQAEVVDLADKVNFLGNTTAASAPKISEVVSRIGPLGEVAGLSSGEIAALGASVVSTGVAPEVAATSIKNLINALGRGSNATKGQAEALQKLGFDSVELAKRLKAEGSPVIVEFLKSLQNLEGYEVNATLGTIVGEEGKAPIAGMANNIGNLEKNLAGVSDSNKSEWSGSMEQEFQARIETAENSMQLLENIFSVTAESLGKALLPVIKDLAESFMPILQSVIEFIRENQKLVGIVLAVSGAIGALLVALGGIGLAVGGIMGLAPVFSAIGGAVTGLGGIFTSVFGFFSGGFTGIILNVLSLFSRIGGAITSIGTALGGIATAAAPVAAGIAIIGSVIYYVYQHWDELKNYFMSSMPEINAAVDQLKYAWEAVQPSIQALMPPLETIANVIGVIIVGAIKILWEIGVAAFSALAEAVNTVVWAINGIIGGIQKAIGWFQELIGLSGQAGSAAANASATSLSKVNNSYSQTNNVHVNSVGEATSFVNNATDFYAFK